MGLLAVNNKCNKTNSEMKNSLFKNSIAISCTESIMLKWNWLKLNVTCSNVLRIIIH